MMVTKWSNINCVLLNAMRDTALNIANPEYARVKTAGINPTGGYSFGVSGDSANCPGSVANCFCNGALIGALPTANGIAISSFSRSENDYSTPTATFAIAKP